MSSEDRPPGRAVVPSALQWARSGPWQVWAAAGSVFVLFAVLGAVMHRAEPGPAGGRGLAAAFEQGMAPTPSVPAPAAPQSSVVPAYGTDRTPDLAPTGVTPTPTPSATSAFYPDCAAAEAAGVAPIRRGRPGYRAALDRDGDGLACDTTAAVPGSPTPSPSGSPLPSDPPVSPTPDPTAVPTDTPSPTVAPSGTPLPAEPGTA